MSNTERRAERTKLKRIHKPNSALRQRYRDEIEEGLEEWDATQTSGRGMLKTLEMDTTTTVDGNETSQDS